MLLKSLCCSLKSLCTCAPNYVTRSRRPREGVLSSVCRRRCGEIQSCVVSRTRREGVIDQICVDWEAAGINTTHSCPLRGTPVLAVLDAGQQDGATYLKLRTCRVLLELYLGLSRRCHVIATPRCDPRARTRSPSGSQQDTANEAVFIERKG